MLPTKYLEELKSAPMHEVDFVATFIEVSCILSYVCREYTEENRCSRESILPWVVDPLFIPE